MGHYPRLVYSSMFPLGEDFRWQVNKRKHTQPAFYAGCIHNSLVFPFLSSVQIPSTFPTFPAHAAVILAFSVFYNKNWANLWCIGQGNKTNKTPDPEVLHDWTPCKTCRAKGNESVKRSRASLNIEAKSVGAHLGKGNRWTLCQPVKSVYSKLS